MIYTVEKDKHDFKPNNQCFFTTSNKIEGTFSPTGSMYFTREDTDYPHGSDAADWNKIAGLTWFLSGNANWSGMLVWRPNEARLNEFEVAAYVNPKSGKFISEKIADVKAGEVLEFQLIHSSNSMTFKFRKQGQESYVFTKLPMRNLPWWFKFYRQIGPYFGGNRAAHKEMKMELDLR